MRRLSGFVAVLVLFSPIFVSAQTVDNSSLIHVLQHLVTLLEAELQTLLQQQDLLATTTTQPKFGAVVSSSPETCIPALTVATSVTYRTVNATYSTGCPISVTTGYSYDFEDPQSISVIGGSVHGTIQSHDQIGSDNVVYQSWSPSFLIPNSDSGGNPISTTSPLFFYISVGSASSSVEVQ